MGYVVFVVRPEQILNKEVKLDLKAQWLMPNKRPRKQVMEVIGEIQDLVGNALSAYQNDRDTDRAKKVIEALEKAFNLAVWIRD